MYVVGDEDKWCKNGGLESPKYLAEGITCKQPEYKIAAEKCVEAYQRSFQVKAPISQLCKWVTEPLIIKTCGQRLQSLSPGMWQNHI